MHNSSENPTSSLEARMRLALNRVLAAVSEDERQVYISYSVHSPDYLAPNTWFVRINNDHFGCGEDLNDAVGQAIASYGTSESRHAKKLERLKADAAALGCEVIEPAKAAA